MGQRLNIEIVNNEKRLANAYYHWSAYTGSAIALTKQVLEAYAELSETIDDPLLLAVRMLESTGAGVNPEERARISADRRFDGIGFQDCSNRNAGILSVTDDGMEETERWEEGRVTVHIDSQSFDFGVYYDEYMREWMDDCEYEDNVTAEKAYHQFPQIDYEMDEIPFSEIDTLGDVYNRSLEAGGFRTSGDWIVLWIE